MKSPARMHKTLVSLAMAMTATAVGLHWMDPAARAGRAAYTANEIITLSRSAVSESVIVQPAIWRDVEITVDDELASNGLALTASHDRRRCHFFVDATGRPSREKHWTTQKPWSGTPNTIRIHLERTSTEGPTAAQWFTARTLILALDAALAARGTIPIHSAIFDPNTVIYSSSL